MFINHCQHIQEITLGKSARRSEFQETPKEVSLVLYSNSKLDTDISNLILNDSESPLTTIVDAGNRNLLIIFCPIVPYTIRNHQNSRIYRSHADSH
ncbi:predicted protein [Sclerotinia sclerotiorum 1980 UF-70]|uniref:Uncharacterized protein n=1 Tax=Sclerotinia sclerotiorum (strain ATCC 18683 / 1980 / Ss-1) TaxID=665079 RepID=A7EPA0_SCLS1|nr:predicted protein [Sclerotinia sclerotiorum 1980 UF-70]EDO04666.1 predicted protein [Sclerotinia sclerotiorum 1980 UF-70]